MQEDLDIAEGYETIPPANLDDHYLEDAGEPFSFPKTYRIDGDYDDEDIMVIEEEGQISNLGEVTIVADIDSLVYTSCDFEKVIDAAGFEHGTLVISRFQ